MTLGLAERQGGLFKYPACCNQLFAAHTLGEIKPHGGVSEKV
jgi:hypothetical protein